MKSYRRYKGTRKSSIGRRLLAAAGILILAFVLVFTGLFAAVLSGSRDRIVGKPEVVIILGCQVMPSGNPSVLLRDRLDTALSYLENDKDTLIIVSGSMGGNEPRTEAECMAEYLIRHGIDEERIIQENRSHNTWENLCYSRDMMEDMGYTASTGVAIVSNGFHLTRARMLWERVTGNDESLSTIAAPSSHLPSRIYMHIREPLALLKSFLFDRG